MAIITAQAKFRTGIRCWCVDKNISANLTSSFSVGNKDIDFTGDTPVLDANGNDIIYPGIYPWRILRVVADLLCPRPQPVLANERYKTYGGGNNVLVVGKGASGFNPSSGTFSVASPRQFNEIVGTPNPSNANFSNPLYRSPSWQLVFTSTTNPVSSNVTLTLKNRGQYISVGDTFTINSTNNPLIPTPVTITITSLLDVSVVQSGGSTITSTLSCEFPTYIQIDIEKLGIPEGTDCIVYFDEGWTLEDRGRRLPSGAWEYPNAIQGSPSPQQDEFVQFRTPYYGVGILTSAFTLPNTVLRIKQLAGAVNSSATVVARGVFNPGKLAALVAGNLITVTNAVKRVSAGATLFNSFGPLDVGGTPILALGLRIKQLASVFQTAVTTLVSDATKFKTPGVVAISTTATILAAAIRTLGPTTANIVSSSTVNVTPRRTVGLTQNISASAGLSASGIVTKGLIQNLTAVSSLSITGSIPMVLETTGSSINLPILYGSVNCVISWGDGTETTVTSPNASWISKTYSSPFGLGVTKQIRISGYIQHYGYATQANLPVGTTGYNESNANTTEAIGVRTKTYYNSSQTITKIVSFGDLGTETFVGAFINARYLNSVPTRLPSTVTNISRMFWHYLADDQFQNLSNVGSWNVSNVTQMEGTFIRCRGGFNPNISGWNVSNVTNMRDLFVFCDNGFNPNISSWDTGSVVNFQRTFYNASNFNQDIGSWDTSSATNMTGMFENAFVFNQVISGWCVTNIPTAPSNFANTSILPIGKWPVWGTCPP